uniref:Uncharacterized protein n=1 Tax=Tanacetum cinerariifolium TaxID=118510 RepID=A0A6L2KWM7_TANCI|nr:hypothetical protein [Tanacetum cinerariifolium]
MANLEFYDKHNMVAFLKKPQGNAHGISTLPTTKFFKQLALMGKTRTNTRRISIRIPQSNVPSSVADKAIIKEMHDGLGRFTTIASSLEAEQGSGGPECHVTMRDSPIQARPKRLSNMPNEPPLRKGDTSQSGEGSMQLLELMDICTKLSDKVTALEDELKMTKVVYNKALITLTKRVKKLEKNLKHKRRRAVIDFSEDEEATEHIIESDDTDEETLAKTLVSIKKSAAEDKGKAIMQESEPPKKIKKKEMIQISLDKEISQRQKKQDDPEELTLMDYVEVISDSKEVINVIPLAVKYPIVNWKSYCKGDVGYYEMLRADRSYKTYIFFSDMLNDFDREDLIVLYRLFNEKYASTRPSFDDLML